MRFLKEIQKILNSDKTSKEVQILDAIKTFLNDNDELVSDDITVEYVNIKDNKTMVISFYWPEDRTDYQPNLFKLIKSIDKNAIVNNNGINVNLSTLVTEDWKSAVTSSLLAGSTFLDPSAQSMSLQDKPMIQYTVNKEPNIVARVIFGETGGTGPHGLKVTDEERYLVASTIFNRIGKKEFGSPDTPKEVVTAPKQYSAYNSTKNSLWKMSEDPNQISKDAKLNWIKSLVLTNKLFANKGNWDKEVVAYHDKSISKPKDWVNNKYWNYVPVKTTPNFIFYKIVPRLQR